MLRTTRRDVAVLSSYRRIIVGHRRANETLVNDRPSDVPAVDAKADDDELQDFAYKSKLPKDLRDMFGILTLRGTTIGEPARLN